MWLFVALVAIPVIEIALFIQIGGAIGTWPTLGLVFLTSLLGIGLVRAQGRQALMKLQRSLSDLSDPAEPLAHGAMMLIAGFLLILPGFFTDAIGFALLVPGLRSAVYRLLRARVAVAHSRAGQEMRFRHSARRNDPFDRQPHRPAGEDVIDGEFQEVEPVKRPTHNVPSGWTRH